MGSKAMINSDKELHEECGIFGFFNLDDHDSAKMAYYGLYALQHRGQESCGIAISDQETIICHKDMGLVSEVFNDLVLDHLKGQMAIGHVRYSTTGSSLRENAQPLVIKYSNGSLALAHNGNLINAKELRDNLEAKGAIFQTTIDSEVIAYLLAKERINTDSTVNAIKKTMGQLKGSYSLIIMEADQLIGVRDPLGIRPLCLGKLNNSYVIASESCALDTINAKFIRDVLPGEIVIINQNGLQSIKTKESLKSHLCIFEYIYFARQDSVIDGISVYEARKKAGHLLAKENKVKADLIIGVPDSGIAAAIGYAEESGIPYGEGLVKNRYVGRTFIQPNQNRREKNVKIKLNVLAKSVAGKKIIMIDDSIVRGTTIKGFVHMLKEAGAKEVHIRISSPPFKWPCFFGTDIPSRHQLLACQYDLHGINKLFGTDSLAYLSIEGLKTITNHHLNFCEGCFSGKYPMEVPLEADKDALEKVN